MRAFLCLAAFAAAMFLLPPTSQGQGPAPGLSQVCAAPLPVTLDIRDADTPPAPERVPKPFVPGKKPTATKKKNKRPAKPKAQATQQAPKKSTAMPAANAQDMPENLPEAPKAEMKTEERPPVVTPPREKISPIVPYIDDAPRAPGQETGQAAGQGDYKAATPDTSPELSPSPAPAQSPEAAPEQTQTPQPSAGKAPAASAPESPQP